MERGRIKRKVIKAGVELRVNQSEGTGYEHIKFFPNKLEARVYAERNFRGKKFTITAVRVDATPIQFDERDTSERKVFRG